MANTTKATTTERLWYLFILFFTIAVLTAYFYRPKSASVRPPIKNGYNLSGVLILIFRNYIAGEFVLQLAYLRKHIYLH